MSNSDTSNRYPYKDGRMRYTNGQMAQYQNRSGSQVTAPRPLAPARPSPPRDMQTAPVTDGEAPVYPPGTAAPQYVYQTPQTILSPYYTAGYLQNHIGKNMRVEFLIGTNGALVDRVGTLLEVGANYIILQPFQSEDTILCDLYSIKFVTIYN